MNVDLAQPRFAYFLSALAAAAAAAAGVSVAALAGCSSSSTPAYTAPTDTGVDTGTDTSAVASDAADAADTASADASEAGTTHTVQVGASGLTFTPSTLTIAVGDKVTWTFASIGHTVTSGSGGVADGKFCSPNDTSCSGGVTSAVGAVYSHTFTTAGTFPYFCAVHFASGMTGTITVTP
jgi:plastocyanin